MARDPDSGRFLSAKEAAKRGPVPTSVTLERRPEEKKPSKRAGVLEYPVSSDAYVLYKEKQLKSGRIAVQVVKFVDASADNALKLTKSREDRQGILRYKADVARTVRRELQAEYDADFQNRELTREVRATISKRAANTRARNKAEGKTPAKKKPTLEEAKAAVLKLEREVRELTRRINNPKAKAVSSLKAQKTRKAATLEHWRAVLKGKKTTFPKGWRKL
jgi:hypothetical protein